MNEREVKEILPRLNARLATSGGKLADTRGNGFRFSEALVKNGVNFQTAPVEQIVDLLYGFVHAKVNLVINQGATNDLEWVTEPRALVNHRRQKGSETVHSANRSQREEPAQETEKQPITQESKRMLEKIYRSIEDSSRRSSVRSFLDDFYREGGDPNRAAHRIEEFLKIEPQSAAESYLNCGQGSDVRDFIFGS